jgi:hypothetical protein
LRPTSVPFTQITTPSSARVVRTTLDSSEALLMEKVLRNWALSGALAPAAGAMLVAMVEEPQPIGAAPCDQPESL